MLKKYIEAGKITGTHGIRGEMRLDTWCDSPEFMMRFKTLYLTSDGKEKWSKVSCRPHKNIAIIKVPEINSVEEADAFRGKIVYIDRTDAKLPKDKYFVQDLIGIDVFDVDSDRCYGKITDVSKTGANDVWHITNESGEYLIPVIDDVVISVDIDNQKVQIRALKGIFDDED
ncbi:MAG: 16S rRNA processing protein RimM [Clostridia bacterium]|nr:16S rRNA processing protein RimM [Clostridia bacterium]